MSADDNTNHLGGTMAGCNGEDNLRNDRLGVSPATPVQIFHRRAKAILRALDDARRLSPGTGLVGLIDVKTSFHPEGDLLKTHNTSSSLSLVIVITEPRPATIIDAPWC